MASTTLTMSTYLQGSVCPLPQAMYQQMLAGVVDIDALYNALLRVAVAAEVWRSEMRSVRCT